MLRQIAQEVLQGLAPLPCQRNFFVARRQYVLLCIAQAITRNVLTCNVADDGELLEACLANAYAATVNMKACKTKWVVKWYVSQLSTYKLASRILKGPCSVVDGLT